MIIHKCPPDGEGKTPCCGKPVFELPRADQITLIEELVTCQGNTQHQWPGSGEHLWSPWYPHTGLPKPTQHRACVHPDCTASEIREAPKG